MVDVNGGHTTDNDECEKETCGGLEKKSFPFVHLCSDSHRRRELSKRARFRPVNAELDRANRVVNDDNRRTLETREVFTSNVNPHGAS